MKTFHGNLDPKSPILRDRDASSFSSYLRLRPDQPNKCESHLSLDHDSTSELSIFYAHKYFNEVTNSSNSRVSPLVNMDTKHKHKHKPERGDITKSSRSYSFASSSVDGYANIKNHRAHSFHAATPTASSSQVNWNSREYGLLSHPPTSSISVSTRNPPHPDKSTDLNKKIRAYLSKPIWLLRRKCPCSCKKSVQVKENTTPTPTPTPSQPPQHQIARDSVDPKTPLTDKLTRGDMETAAKIPITPNKAIMFVNNSQRFQSAMNQVQRPNTEGFTFPVLNPHSAILAAAAATSPTKKLQVLNVVHEEEDPPRLQQVFQPSSPPSPKSRANVMDDDAASDASSDLFEIESFSTTTLTYPMTPPPTISSECHEPSKATSIDWSTVANFLADDTSSSTVICGGAECVEAVAEGHRGGATTTVTALTSTKF